MSLGPVWSTLAAYVAGVTVFFMLMGVADEWSVRNLILGAVGMALGLAQAVLLYRWRTRRRASGRVNCL